MGLFPNKQRATGITTTTTAATNSTDLLVQSLLPNPPAIPVYSTQDENDVYLRAYQHCPTFNDRLQQLFESTEWKTIEENNKDLLSKLGRIFPEKSVDGAVPLKDVWNVYDPMHVAVTECTDTSSSCDALVPLPSLSTALSGEDFDRLEVLTEKTEHMKYGRQETAGNLLGSNLLWKIIQRSSLPNGGTFFLYSAHAPTILSFLATLQAADEFVSASMGERFVDYGSALIFEVYQEDGTGTVPGRPMYMKLKYKSTELQEAVGIPLSEGMDGTPCGTLDLDASAEYCAFDKITLWAAENTLIGPEHWCRACNNIYADVCLRARYAIDEEGFGDDTSDNKPYYASSGTNENGDDSRLIVVSFFGGFLAGLVVLGSIAYICYYSKKRSDDVPAGGKDLAAGCDTTNEMDNDGTAASADGGGDDDRQETAPSGHADLNISYDVEGAKTHKMLV
jgi:hypothetical protein